jgi:hypothetical protein
MYAYGARRRPFEVIVSMATRPYTSRPTSGEDDFTRMNAPPPGSSGAESKL